MRAGVRPRPERRQPYSLARIAPAGTRRAPGGEESGTRWTLAQAECQEDVDPARSKQSDQDHRQANPDRAPGKELAVQGMEMISSRL